MANFWLDELHTFILHAKTVTYVGGGAKVTACRPASHDLKYQEGEFAYLDSYFGGKDFIGEEAVWFAGEPVWAENYYGYILKPELIAPAQAGKVIQASLSRMYAENRFLGGYNYQEEPFIYFDTSEGEFTHFKGLEWIERDGVKVYELVYHGGLIKD